MGVFETELVVLFSIVIKSRLRIKSLRIREKFDLLWLWAINYKIKKMILKCRV